MAKVGGRAVAKAEKEIKKVQVVTKKEKKVKAVTAEVKAKVGVRKKTRTKNYI